MTTITLEMMAITINAKIMMVITIIHQMDRSEFDGIHRNHPSLMINMTNNLLVFQKNALNRIYTLST